MAEQKLTGRLGAPCRIELIKGDRDGLAEIIWSIDHKKFREELRYDIPEILERMSKPGFLCLMVYLDDVPIAFEYGYDESPHVYYSDSQATLIEGKGVGTTQFALELLYLYQHGYGKVTLSTEELDDQGRPLTSIWAAMGFIKTGQNQDGNIDMVLELTPENMLYQYRRYIEQK